MRMTPLTVALLLLGVASSPAHAGGDAIEVPLRQDVAGVEQVFRRCFAELREDGHDPERMSATGMAACMRPEVEAMAEFAYEVSTAYAVSRLTRIALETCTLEQAAARTAAAQVTKQDRRERSTWRWLTDCVKEVRWLEHDEQTARLEKARRDAKRSQAID